MARRRRLHLSKAGIDVVRRHMLRAHRAPVPCCCHGTEFQSLERRCPQLPDFATSKAPHPR